MNKLKIISEALAILILSAGVLFLFSVFVPFDMDEFGLYINLAHWLHPLSELNEFNESPHLYDLAPFGHNYFLPLMSYQYSGSCVAFLYYPLYLIWPAPYSIRLLGMLMLVAQAFLIYKILKIDPLLSFILLVSYMPYAFQHLADKGAVGYQTTSIFLICYLTQKWMSSLRADSRYSGLYPLAIGIIMFVVFWIKLSFLFILPGILCLMAYHVFLEKDIFISSDHSRSKKFIQHILIMLCAGGVPALILLNSVNRAGYKYYGYLTSTTQNPINRDWHNLLAHFLQLATYLVNPLMPANYMFNVKIRVTFLGIAMFSAITALLFFGIRQCHLKKIKIIYPAMNIAIFIFAFFLLSLSRRTYRFHHTVLLLPFILLAMLYIGSKLYKNIIVTGLICVFLATNYIAYYEITKLEPVAANPITKTKLSDLLNKKYAKDYVFIIIDWGLYYMKALYGPRDQCVIYFSFFKTPKHAASIREVLKKTGRKPMFIGREHSRSNLSLLKKEFPGLVELKTDFDTKDWRVWYEK